MIDEVALLAWSEELCGAMGKSDVLEAVRVLEYAYAFGTPIPEKHLIDALQSHFAHPPDRPDCRNALIMMGLIPSSGYSVGQVLKLRSENVGTERKVAIP